jgi:dual specificity protein kinase YAK1
MDYLVSEDGYLVVLPGNPIKSPSGLVFTIVKSLGRGQFGQVFQVSVRHSTTGQTAMYAMKISRLQAIFRDQARHEASTLAFLMRQATAPERSLFARLLSHFDFAGHTCIVTELLGSDLYTLLQSRDSVGLPIAILQSFARDLFQALVFFKRCSVVHGDLKPENVLVANHAETHVKVIDFGSARLVSQPQKDYIQSRYYRAPEIVMRIVHGMAIDVWSVGCVLIELFLAVPLFPAQSEHQLLEWQTKFLGNVPKEVRMKSPVEKELFLESGELKSEEQYCAEMGIPLPQRFDYHQFFTVRELVMNADYEPDYTDEEIEIEVERRGLLSDLLERIFVFPQEERITPEAALEHPFMATNFLES